TSKYITTRYGSYPIIAEFAPGWRIALRPNHRHQFFLAPGVYHVRFYTWYFGIRVGKAEAVVDTRSGQPVFVAYAAPYTIWTRGRAGYPPQQRPGLAAIPVIVLIALLVMAAVVLAALSSG